MNAIMGRPGVNRWFRTGPKIEKPRITREFHAISSFWGTGFRHYSVVVDIGRKYIYLMDPEIGKVRKMDLTTFYRVWFDFPGDVMKSNSDLILRRMVVLFKPEKR